MAIEWLICLTWELVCFIATLLVNEFTIFANPIFYNTFVYVKNTSGTQKQFFAGKIK